MADLTLTEIAALIAAAVRDNLGTPTVVHEYERIFATREPLVLPAVIIQVSGGVLSAERSMRPGAAHWDADWVAYCLTDELTSGARLQALRLALAVGTIIHHLPGDVRAYGSPADIAVEEDTLNPDLDGYAVCAVRWRQPLRLSLAALNARSPSSMS